MKWADWVMVAILRERELVRRERLQRRTVEGQLELPLRDPPAPATNRIVPAGATAMTTTIAVGPLVTTTMATSPGTATATPTTITPDLPAGTAPTDTKDSTDV
jgi:hypothetical protein